MLDLTTPGCLLETVIALERGQGVQLLIALAELRPMRITLGVVRWVSGKTAGIEFIRMSPEGQNRRRAFMGSKQPQLRLSVRWGEPPLCVAY